MSCDSTILCKSWNPQVITQTVDAYPFNLNHNLCQFLVYVIAYRWPNHLAKGSVRWHMSHFVLCILSKTSSYSKPEVLRNLLATSQSIATYLCDIFQRLIFGRLLTICFSHLLTHSSWISRCRGGRSLLYSLRPCDIHWTQWGRVTHICVGELTIIVSDNGLSPGRRQAIIWTNAGMLLFGPYGTNFNEI